MFLVATLQIDFSNQMDWQCKFQWWHFVAFRNSIPNPQKTLKPYYKFPFNKIIKWLKNKEKT